MTKVLMVATTPLCTDGLTSVLITIAKIVNDNHAVGFVLGEVCEDYIQTQLQVIGKIHQLPSRKKSTIAYVTALSRLIRTEGYDVVHIHGNSQTMAIDLVASRKCPVRITHCHNWAQQSMLKKLSLGVVMNALVTHPVACSQEAGRALYSKPFTVIRNGIDLERFHYSASLRESMRSKLSLGTSFTVGHIGRFTEQKNHQRLISIFREVAAIRTNAVLVLCGDGELREEIEDLSAGLNIRFCGIVENPQAYMMAMDVLVLPSLFEGLPLVGVEAQATGLPCVFADTITREAAILDQVTFLSLEDDDRRWAEVICKQKAIHREGAAAFVGAAGYGFEQVKADVEALYKHFNSNAQRVMTQ